MASAEPSEREVLGAAGGPDRVVVGRRLLRMLAVGLLAVLLVDAVLAAAVVGWYRAVAGLPASEDAAVTLLRGAMGALIGVTILATVITILVVVTLLAVRPRRNSSRRR